MFEPPRRRVLAATALALLAGAAHAQATLTLVTPAEAAEAARAEAARTDTAEPTLTRSLPAPRAAAPAIRVLAPQAAGSPVPAPLRIEFAFDAGPGTRIVPGSFRLLYGLLKLDLTERLRPQAAISERGVVIERAQVPDGQHRFVVQVADDQGNVAEQELRVRVGVAP